jgi:hypothetical protein
VEFNGEKIQGTFHEIISKISETKIKQNTAVEHRATNAVHQKNAFDEHEKSQQFYKKYIEPVEM